LVKALWELPEFQKQYRSRLAELATNVWQVDVMTNRMAGMAARLMAVAPDRLVARQIEEELQKLRSQFVRQQQLLMAELRRKN
jgi:hypothetical protein